MQPAVRVEDLGKSYRVDRASPRGAANYRTLRDDLSEWATAPLRRLRGGPPALRAEDFWALRDVGFEIEPGEVVGVIGRNGAGKSTLLKVLSRITRPTTGRVELRGRVGSLLEVGAGFHHELTGRENIRLNGVILGMSRAQIARAFDAIVDFAGVEAFLDTPVKRYSSGMYVRLAFAVAAHLETELLLVDEVLAVGDAEFQKKCLGRMSDLSGSGRTIFFVSHNLPTVRSLTHRCLYLRDGRLVAEGPTAETIDHYLADAWRRKTGPGVVDVEYYRRDRASASPVTFRRLWFADAEGREADRFRSGEPITLRCEIEAKARFPEACVAYWLTNQSGERVATFFTHDQAFTFGLNPGRVVVSSTIADLPLSPGKYTVSISVNQTSQSMAFDHLSDFPAFEIDLPEFDAGEIPWPRRPWGCVHWRGVAWSLEGPDSGYE